MSTPDIETILHAAPGPKPPPGLKAQLIAQVHLPVSSNTARASASTSTNFLSFGGWLRRWWPTLVPASVSLACAVILTVQQMEIRDLKDTLQALSPGATSTEITPAAPVIQPLETAATQSENGGEIARLKASAARLTAEIAQLEQLRVENGTLRAQLAAPPAGYLTTEESEAMNRAKEKALTIQCMNNMKQLGLAARMWAMDNNEIYPPNVLDMTNEMNTPKILHCPSDTARPIAESFANYTTANCSYEFLAASGSDQEPTRVLFRCPIHGHIGLCDGSVQAGVAKDHSERLVQQDGKLYLDSPTRLENPQTRPPRNAGNSNPNGDLRP